MYGQHVLIGSAHFVFNDKGVVLSDESKNVLSAIAKEASVIYLAVGGNLASVLCIEDPVREDATAAIKRLRDFGFEKIMILTGDSSAVAESVCNALGIEDYIA